MLDGVLLRVADQLKKKAYLRRKIKSTMTYPITVLAFAALAASLMLLFIVPVFAGLFENLGGTLLLPTRIVIAVFDILVSVLGALVCTGMCAGIFHLLSGTRPSGPG